MNPFRKRGNSFEINLIERVRRYPYLYNSKDAHHVDSGLCLRTWQQIALEMSSTTLQCKAKWRVLRCNFIRAYRQHAYKSGSDDQGIEDTMRPKWVYFNHLMFLEPFIAKRRPTDRLDLTHRAMNPAGQQSLYSQDISQDMSSLNNREELIDSAKIEPTVIELDDDNSQDNNHMVVSDSGSATLKPSPISGDLNSLNPHYYSLPVEPNMIRNPYQHLNVSSGPLNSTVNVSSISSAPNSNFNLNRTLDEANRLVTNVFSQQLIKPSISLESPPKRNSSFFRDMTSKSFLNGKRHNSELATGLLSSSEQYSSSSSIQEDELFGKFVGTVLGSITGRNKGLARMEIQQILFKYKYDSS